VAELDLREWLEPDGLGGFASGTVSGPRTRRYHALLLAATTPPTGRVVLVNGLDAHVATPRGTFALSSQRYLPDVVSPDGASRLRAFRREPWPTWEWELADGLRVAQELFACHGAPRTVLRWRLLGPRAEAVLQVRPFLSGRDYHALHHENPAFGFAPREALGQRVSFLPYPGLPAVDVHANGRFEAAPEWYRRFLYTEERRRGLDDVEDLASPGVWHFDLGAGPAAIVLEAGADDRRAEDAAARAARLAAREEARRGDFATPLERAADAYLVRRGEGRTLVAGYPWFTDWGRDTMIALRGLCLATGRLADARAILLEWAGAVSEGMLPNRFPDRGEAPEYNAVDASLWFVVAADELLARGAADAAATARLAGAIERVLDGYARGTRYGIAMDGDGLLRAGEAGAQLTWMDARVGEHVVTPRHGKPVEVQALWIHALRAGARRAPRFAPLAERALGAFRTRFWDARRGWLLDVADPDDASFRPNQILAVGGLPSMLLEPADARRVVDAVEARLLTPLGLRSLAPDDPAYRGRYEGGPAERDGAYHQGTVWPWLLGPFVEAWVRVRGDTESVRSEARARFVAPLRAHLEEAGLGHVSEVADGDAPHRPGGCPFQAWSLGELVRLERWLG
jgi:predicted glycogen debranching enzyme